ncbi:MAG TPA: L-threonylcarbamoyladenylate synthase [Polyangiales bacterium]|nr:L-threonylcarbamoyladenylate synthase [Polyangiales bacterium]
MPASVETITREPDLYPYVSLLRAGGVLACPTETQMGLLADALSEAAVAKVCELKGRPAGEALSVIVPSLEQALRLVRDVSDQALRIARAHWPGPLTLVLRARDGLPGALIKDGKLALRVPGASPALALVRAFGGPLTATSANASGRPPLSSAAELRATFGSGLGGIVPGVAPGSAASTIVDLTGERPLVLRQGAVIIGQ